MSSSGFQLLCKGCQAWLNKATGSSENGSLGAGQFKSRKPFHTPEDREREEGREGGRRVVKTMAACRSDFETRLRRGIIVEEVGGQSSLCAILICV